MHKYLIIGSLLFAQSALACNPVQFIKRGDPSNCDGYVFSTDQELQVRRDKEELKTTKMILDNSTKLIGLKDQQNSLLDSQVVLWRTQSEALSKQLVDRENSSFWHNTLYFALGAALTTALAFGVNKAINK
jgi:hypothetical protein